MASVYGPPYSRSSVLSGVCVYTLVVYMSKPGRAGMALSGNKKQNNFDKILIDIAIFFIWKYQSS